MELQQIADKYGLKFIIIFGSRASGISDKLSDTDVAVYSNHMLSEIEKIQLIHELSNILETEKLDLVDIKTAHPFLRKKIFENYKIIHCKDIFLLYQIELASLYEYIEAKPLYEMMYERLKDFVND